MKSDQQIRMTLSGILRKVGRVYFLENFEARRLRLTRPAFHPTAINQKITVSGYFRTGTAHKVFWQPRLEVSSYAI